MRIKFIVSLCLFTLSVFSQKVSLDEIDSILNESFVKFSHLQFIESSTLANKALELSIIENYSEGKAKSNLYIAKVLVEVGLNNNALMYIQNISKNPFFKQDVILQVESHRLKGKIYGSQRLYALANKEFLKQLSLSESVSDPKKRELSKLWSYQNLEFLFYLQGQNDSIEVYQKLQEKQLFKFEEREVFYDISTLCVSRAKLYLAKAKFEEAALQLRKSLAIIEKYNSPYKYYSLQTFGDLEAAQGNVTKAIFYYNEALENSVLLHATFTSRDLHKRLSDYMLMNDTLQDRAKEHGIIYSLLNDSIENDSKSTVNTIFENLIRDNENKHALMIRTFWYVVVTLILVSVSFLFFLILRNRRIKQTLQNKSQQLVSNVQKIDSLEKKLECNIFKEIVELAKTNSPEFLVLFMKGYPEFVDAMKQLDPNIRSSELQFCALIFLNFSTKDISNFTFVSIRAVQVRKNRLRKKYNIPSELDLNEWFRSLYERREPATDNDSNSSQ